MFVNDSYEIVVEGVVCKIMVWDENVVVVLYDCKSDDVGEDDLYVGYEIFDDLMW